MAYRFAADVVLLLHAAFIVFVLIGALLALRRPWLIIAHLPAVAWGFFVEVTGRQCPLTSIENFLRFQAGQAGHADGFIEHYVVAAIYPAGLTRDLQFVLGAVVLVVNLAAYAWLVRRRRRMVRLPPVSPDNSHER